MTTNSPLFTVSSNQKTKVLFSVSRNNNNYLNKKRKRENNFLTNFIKDKKPIHFDVKKPMGKNYGLNPVSKKIVGSKSVIRPLKNKKQIQSTINDFFTSSTIDEHNMKDSLLNSYDGNNSSLSAFEDKNNNKKNKIDEITQTINKEKYEENENNDNSNCIDIDNQSLQFSELSFVLNKYKDNYNYSINNNNHIFTDCEITSALNIQKEFTNEINSLNSETDKIIKTTFFFLSKGFNESVRYNIYKCLINYGFPLIENFNSFYDIFMENSGEKENIPEKMYMEFYIEYIFNFLIKDKISTSKSKLISDFFFNGENINIIKSNLNFINHFKNNNNNSRIFIQNYLGINFDKLFNEVSIRINNQFPKSKHILCRILSNIVLECNKNGYLNYKQIINNDDIMFNGLKIKVTADITINYRKMISTRIFGQEMSEIKFNHVMQDYFLELLTKFKN